MKNLHLYIIILLLGFMSCTSNSAPKTKQEKILADLAKNEREYEEAEKKLGILHLGEFKVLKTDN